ncbi:MAG: hypothetical protein AAGF31_06075 [Planctomycetota bacterium]
MKIRTPPVELARDRRQHGCKSFLDRQLHRVIHAFGRRASAARPAPPIGEETH